MEQDFPHFHFPCLRSLLMIPHSALGETRREVRGMISDQKWAKTFQVLFTKSESILHLYQSIGLLKSHMPSLPSYDM